MPDHPVGTHLGHGHMLDVHEDVPELDEENESGVAP